MANPNVANGVGVRKLTTNLRHAVFINLIILTLQRRTAPAAKTYTRLEHPQKLVRTRTIHIYKMERPVICEYYRKKTASQTLII